MDRLDSERVIEQAMTTWQKKILSDKSSGIMQTVGSTRHCLNDWLNPQTLLHPRATVNSLQVQNSRFGITSVKTPANKKSFSFGL